MKIHSNNEWGKLRSIVVGTALNANFPAHDYLYFKSMEGGAWKDTLPPVGPPPEQVIEESEEDLDLLIHTLDRFAVTVYRPDTIDFTKKVSTSDWETDSQYGYCPRDTHLVVGDTVIEAPMTTRARQHEAILLDKVRRQAIADGAKWISAPRPRLLDEENVIDDKFQLNNLEPAFDAANVCRLGKDLLYLVSCSGNKIGAQWLQNVLGSEYKVHICDMYNSSHIDSTIVPIAEGTVVLNGTRVNPDNIPDVFKDWDQIYMQDSDIYPRAFHEYPYASKWIGINMLSINQNTVIVDEMQDALITTLEKKNFTVVPLPLRHSRTLGGGFHCATLDLWREDD